MVGCGCGRLGLMEYGVFCILEALEPRSLHRRALLLADGPASLSAMKNADSRRPGADKTAVGSARL